MVRTVLKHEQQCSYTAKLLGFKSSSLKQVVAKYLKVISEHLRDTYVQSEDDEWTLSRFRLKPEMFQSFAYLRYSIVAPVHQSSWRTGNVSKRKVYSSRKPKLYGYRVEMSVLTSRSETTCAAHYAGHVADLNSMKENKASHEEALVYIGLQSGGGTVLL